MLKDSGGLVLARNDTVTFLPFPLFLLLLLPIVPGLLLLKDIPKHQLLTPLPRRTPASFHGGRHAIIIANHQHYIQLPQSTAEERPMHILDRQLLHGDPRHRHAPR